MANFRDAADAVGQVFDALSAQVHIRPNSAGVISIDDGFGLKVVLPSVPEQTPPAVLFGVPIEYHVAAEGPAMLSAPGPAWQVASRRRRAGG